MSEHAKHLAGLRAFAGEMIQAALDGGDMDGASIQESAIKHGLLAAQQMPAPCCGPEDGYCRCAYTTEFPIECFRPTQAMTEADQRDARIAEQLREITQLRRELGIVQEVANSALKAQQPSAGVVDERAAFEDAMGASILAEQGKFSLSRSYDAGNPYTFLATKWAWEAWQARALLAAAQPAALDASQVERWKRDSQLLDAIEGNCWGVRYSASPNADAGDSNINIEIVGHFMDKPCERVVGENYSENLRAALEQALTADAYPPVRPEYGERDD